MKNQTQIYTDANSVKDGYPQFEQAVVERFNMFVGTGVKLFKTNVEDIFENIFLDHMSEESGAKQHYNCNACRSFFNKYGSLVAVSENGELKSVLWNDKDVPEFFKQAVKVMKNVVEGSNVTGVFLSDTKVLGHPVTGEWTHIHVKLPSEMVFRSRLETAGQAMAVKREEFNMVNRAVRDFSLDTINKALTLINSETLYRGDKAKPNVEWFKSLVEKVKNADTADKKKNIIWLAIAEAPNGFAHIRSNATGTLLKDISEGLSTEEVASKFKQVMNPSNYQRSQSAPSENSIYEAEKVVAQLGIENSLARKYATLEEVQKTWTPNLSIQEPVTTQGVFGHLTSKSKADNTMDLPKSVMTWEKFLRTVLPTADSLEVKVDSPDRFMAMVTAVHPESENILQWSNPFSWYYHGGVDGEIKRRVEEAGGRYENNEIRASLIWDGRTDLDLHCVTPYGEHIMYSNKNGNCGGFLDLDMNGLDRNSDTPVENMRWKLDAPQGRYKFYVHNFSERVNGSKGTPFRVELEVNGKVYQYDGSALKNGEKVTVFEFDYVKGRDPIIRGIVNQPTDDTWNVPFNSFVKVNAITDSPNQWDKNSNNGSGHHIFFLLDGVKDLSEGKGRGFFNEMLKPELKQIRKTLELFTANTPIEDADEATACGVGYSKDQEWNLTLKVKSGHSSRVVKIDRWD